MIRANSGLALINPSLEFHGQTASGMRNAAREIMKKPILIFAVAIFAAAFSYAQPTSSSPDPKAGAETTGTIKEYTPGTILILNTLAPNEPTQFKLSKSVVYSDADGKPLEAPGLTTNQKVRVHYMKTAGENVADRVTIIKE
jgi:hypothetical protein